MHAAASPPAAPPMVALLLQMPRAPGYTRSWPMVVMLLISYACRAE